MDFGNLVQKWIEESSKVDFLICDLFDSLPPSLATEVRFSAKLRYSGIVPVTLEKGQSPQIAWSLRSNFLDHANQRVNFLTVTFRYLGGEQGFQSGRLRTFPFNPNTKGWLNCTEDLNEFLSGLCGWPEEDSIKLFLEQITATLPKIVSDLTTYVREKVKENKENAVFLLDKILYWTALQRAGLKEKEGLKAELRGLKEEIENTLQDAASIKVGA